MSQDFSSFRLELVFDRDCPNLERARAIIRAALDEIGAEHRWTEWDRSDAATPAGLRGYGSPTVLVNGRDVGCAEYAASETDANSCRVYLDDCGRLAGAPSSEQILSSIRGIQSASSDRAFLEARTEP